MADGLFVIIDGHYFCYRFFFGAAHLRGPDGRDTGVTFAFAELFARLRRDPAITHWAAVFDHDGPSFRNRLFPEYKAHRDPMPSELEQQLPDVMAVADAMGVPRLAVPDFEADDTIATLAHSADAAGIPVRICTRDKDLDQVLGPTVWTWDPLKDVLRGPDQVRSERKVEVDQVIDFLSMVGDSADNVPGIRGIGPKTAAALLERYGSLEGVLAHRHELRGKRAERVEEFLPRAALVRELITIVDVPDLPAIERFEKPDALPADAGEVLAGFGFSTARFGDAPQLRCASHDAAIRRASGAEVMACCDRLRLGRQPIAIAPVHTSDGHLRLLAVASDPERRSADLLDATDPAARSAIAGVLADPAVPVVVGDAHATLAACARSDLPVAHLAGDPLLAAWLLDPEHAPRTLTPLLRDHLRETIDPTEADAGTLAATRAHCLLRLHHRLESRLDAAGALAAYRERELPAAAVLAAANAAGLGVDQAALAQGHDHLDAYRLQLEHELAEIAGRRFDPTSPSQVVDLLFGRLDLPVLRRTRGGPCIDEGILATLAADHEAADLLLQHRQLLRLTGDGGLDRHRDPATGRIHPRFDPRGDHGCIAIADPDLARLPDPDGLGREIRQALCAEPGHHLVVLRWNAAELRTLAHLSGDEELEAACAAHRDAYRGLAAHIHRREARMVPPSLRRAAVCLARAVIAGSGGFALAQRLGVPRAEADALLAEFAALFPTAHDWIERTVAAACEAGRATTRGGRHLRLTIDPNPTRQLHARRSALAWNVVGSTADFAKQALVAAAGACGCTPVPTGDGLVLECPDHRSDELAQRLRPSVGACWPGRSPITLTITHGHSLAAVG